MDKMIRFFGFLTCMIFCGQSFAAAIVYEVTKGKDKIYLAGTIHMLRSQDFPPPAEFDAAYQQSQKIYFETNIQYSQTPEFGQRFATAMTLPDNTTLKDVLSADTWAALQAFAEKSQYPLSQLMIYNAAMTSMLITISESKKIGIGDGVDVYYDNLARKDKKMIGELESADDVISYMKSFAQEDPDKIIKNTLSDVENIPQDLKSLITFWKTGNLDALEREMGVKMRSEVPEVYKLLLIDRNKKWLPQVEQMFDTPEVEMVLVGSLHLSGKDGLLVKLKKSGYKVKPYQVKK